VLSDDMGFKLCSNLASNKDEATQMTTIIPDIDFDAALAPLCEGLPETALEKLLMLKEREEKHDAWAASKWGRREPILEQIRELDPKLQRYLRNRGRDGWDADDEKTLGTLQKQCGQLQEKMVAIQSESLPPDLPLATVREALHDNRGTKYEDARTPVRVPMGDERDALAKQRTEIERLTQALTAVRKSPVPYDMALQRTCADIDALAMRGRPDFTRTASMVPMLKGERQGDTKWPLVYLDTGSRSVETIDAPTMLAWLHTDALKARAKAELAAFYEGRLSFKTMTERAAAIADAEAKLLAAERREEAIVEICESRRIEVQRRPKANPLAVLGIARVEK
jgi:hypothetical protein